MGVMPLSARIEMRGKSVCGKMAMGRRKMKMTPASAKLSTISSSARSWLLLRLFALAPFFAGISGLDLGSIRQAIAPLGHHRFTGLHSFHDADDIAHSLAGLHLALVGDVLGIHHHHGSGARAFLELHRGQRYDDSSGNLSGDECSL